MSLSWLLAMPLLLLWPTPGCDTPGPSPQAIGDLGPDRADIGEDHPGRSTRRALGHRIRKRLSAKQLHFRAVARDNDRLARWALAVAADLHAGSEPDAALRRAAQVHDYAHSAAAAARVGGNVPEALLKDAARDDVAALRSISACWRLGLTTGAGLASGIEAVVDGRRQALQVRRSLTTELAGARATARMMSALPLAGVGLGWLAGANPIGWLTGTPLGYLTLVVGVGLNCLGAAWTHRIAMHVQSKL